MKKYISLGIFIFGSLGGWLGTLVDSGNGLGGWAIVLSTVGGLFGIWAGYKLGQYWG